MEMMSIVIRYAGENCLAIAKSRSATCPSRCTVNEMLEIISDGESGASMEERQVRQMIDALLSTVNIGTRNAHYRQGKLAETLITSCSVNGSSERKY